MCAMGVCLPALPGCTYYIWTAQELQMAEYINVHIERGLSLTDILSQGLLS